MHRALVWACRIGAWGLGAFVVIEVLALAGWIISALTRPPAPAWSPLEVVAVVAAALVALGLSRLARRLGR